MFTRRAAGRASGARGKLSVLRPRVLILLPAVSVKAQAAGGQASVYSLMVLSLGASVKIAVSAVPILSLS